MQLNASEISDLIKKEIEGFDFAVEARTEGTVISVSDGIVRIHGLADAQFGEMLEFPGNTFGLALNLEQDSVGAVVLGNYLHISEGDTVKCTNRIMEVPVGNELLGRVVNPLGEDLEGKGEIKTSATRPIEVVAPGVIERQSVDQPIQTGIKAIDAMVPIGRGQRELIIGDRQTGKTAVAIDTIINQKDTGVKCIYVAIGQKASSIAAVVRKLEEHGALAHTIIVSAAASESAALQYIAPYAGCAMGEYFRDRGEEEMRNFRQALGSFPTGVTVVTTLDKDSKPIGFTANSFTSVSLEPHLILICIDKASFNIEAFSKGNHFAVSILSESQHQISNTFALPATDRFDQINWEPKITGSPIINESVAWFDCIKDSFIDAGDHFILIGRVQAFDSSTNTPLVYLRGNYVNLGLEKKMLLAIENEDTKILVGALIEWRKKIFLLKNESDGALYFPTATRLGSVDDDNSLLGKLQKLQISVTEHYLFSVFENSDDKTSLIYYRAQVEDGSSVTAGQFYEFDTIPFERLADESSRIMIKRYIVERELNAFGIFVGKESEGKVEAITKTNNNL